MECVCNKEDFTVDTNCGFCKIDMKGKPNEFYRKFYCKQHKHIAFCGLPGFICEKCKELGWVDRSGIGGGPRIENKKTGEAKSLK